MREPTEKELKRYVDELTARIMGAVDPFLVWNLTNERYAEMNDAVKRIIAGETVWDRTGKE